MRIIAGTARRIVIEVAKGSSTRPFLEVARGALFNSLGSPPAGTRVLDLYAGSGALGLEALSRGAESCVFVEWDAAAFGVLLRNIGKCRMQDRAKARRLSAEAFLADDAGHYELIFVDPPFREAPEWRIGGEADASMRVLARRLAIGGTAILRMENGSEPPEWPGLDAAGGRHYGRSLICRYRKR
ncbi:MAG: RsmD family RNA methyltransferase [Planctomycetota bacterium]|nr:RsmD family RNA methyltransferase [Planctomycetota bacterium]